MLQNNGSKHQQSAYKRRSSANAIMNQAYEAQQTAYANQQAAWDAYMSVKQANGPRIDSLNSQQERAYHNMVSAFESASSAYYARDGASARMYADQDMLTKQNLKLVLLNGASLSLKFALLVNSLRLSGQLFKGLKASILKLDRNFYPPKQSTNAHKLNSNVPRPSLMLVPRRSRIGSMNWIRHTENGVKKKSRSLQRLESHLNIETTSGFRKIQMATPISTSVGLVSLMVLGTGTTSWTSMEPWHIGAIRLTRMVRRTSPMHLVGYCMTVARGQMYLVEHCMTVARGQIRCR